MAQSENWIQTCNATLPTQTFMCSGGCSTKHETEFGKRLRCEKSVCGNIKGEADLMHFHSVMLIQGKSLLASTGNYVVIHSVLNPGQNFMLLKEYGVIFFCFQMMIE
jgi:hypothetical protein